MPIGCAGAITRGAPFEEFIMQGATMLGQQLDLSGSTDVASDSESPLAAELAEARAYLVELEGMDEAAARTASDADYAQRQSAWEAGQRANVALRQRYEAALERLHAWSPDIPAYRSLKSRLMEDIGLSITCDCSKIHRPPVHMGYVEWRIQMMCDQTMLIQHLERKQRQFCAMSALRKSLGIEPDAPT